MRDRYKYPAPAMGRMRTVAGEGAVDEGGAASRTVASLLKRARSRCYSDARFRLGCLPEQGGGK